MPIIRQIPILKPCPTCAGTGFVKAPRHRVGTNLAFAKCPDCRPLSKPPPSRSPMTTDN